MEGSASLLYFQIACFCILRIGLVLGLFFCCWVLSAGLLRIVSVAVNLPWVFRGGSLKAQVKARILRQECERDEIDMGFAVDRFCLDDRILIPREFGFDLGKQKPELVGVQTQEHGIPCSVPKVGTHEKTKLSVAFLQEKTTTILCESDHSVQRRPVVLSNGLYWSQPPWMDALCNCNYNENQALPFSRYTASLEICTRDEKVFDSAKKRKLAKLLDLHEKDVFGMDMSWIQSRGLMLICHVSENTVKLWNIDYAKPIATCRDYTENDNSLLFAPQISIACDCNSVSLVNNLHGDFQSPCILLWDHRTPKPGKLPYMFSDFHPRGLTETCLLDEYKLKVFNCFSNNLVDLRMNVGSCPFAESTTAHHPHISATATQIDDISLTFFTEEEEDCCNDDMEFYVEDSNFKLLERSISILEQLAKAFCLAPPL